MGSNGGQRGPMRDHNCCFMYLKKREITGNLSFCQLKKDRLLAADLDNWLLTPGGGDDSDYLIERGYLPVRDDGYHDDELGGSY